MTSNATDSIKADVFTGFQPNSKVWIYASDRMLTEDEVKEINSGLIEFTRQWVSHNVALKAGGKVIENRFIILAVDESVEHPGGCSIDKSIHFIKSIESQFGTKLFDRLTIYYKSDNEMKSFHFNELIEILDSGVISKKTPIYDTTITQLGELQSEFIKAAGKSWLDKFMN